MFYVVMTFTRFCGMACFDSYAATQNFLIPFLQSRSTFS